MKRETGVSKAEGGLLMALLCFLLIGTGGCASTAPLPKESQKGTIKQTRKDFANATTSGGPPVLILKAPARTDASFAPPSPPPYISTNPLRTSAGAIFLLRDPSGCVWYESQAEVEGDENTTPRTLRLRAVARAEKKALRTYRPREITRAFLSSSTELREGGPSKGSQYVEELLRAEDRALVVKEDLMRVEGPFPLPGCSGCQRVRVTVRDCLSPLSTASRSFGLSVHLNRDLFRDGEKAEVSVFSGRTASLLLLDENPETHMYTVIAPRPPALPVWTIRAGETVIFPGSDLVSRGITLIARLPQGESHSTEILRVIATEVPLPSGEYQPRQGKTTFELLSRLERKRIPWAQAGIVFRIVGAKKDGKKLKGF